MLDANKYNRAITYAIACDYLQFGQWNDIGIGRPLPNRAVILGVVVVVPFGRRIVQFPPLVLVGALARTNVRRAARA